MIAPPARDAAALALVGALVAAALASGSSVVLTAGALDSGVDRSDGSGVTTESVSNGTDATVMVAPDRIFNRLTSVTAIEREREAGLVTPSTAVAAGDAVVFRLTLPGFADRVADAAGDSADARFRSVLARENVSLRAVQQHVGPHQDRRVLYLNGSTGQSVAADPANDTYYIVADLTAVPNAEGGVGAGEYRRHTTFVPRLVVDGQHRLNPGDINDENHTGTVLLVEREAELAGAGDDMALRPGFAAAPNQTVIGDTTLAPGSTLAVRVTNATGIETPRTVTARVARQRSKPDPHDTPAFGFETALNLSGVQPGTGVRLTVVSNGTVVSPQYSRDRYRTPVDSPEAGVQLATTPVENQSVRVAHATLPDGGYVVVKRPGGPVVGSTDLLDPGTYEDVRMNVTETAVEAQDERLIVYLAHESVDNGRYLASYDRAYADSMRRVGTTVSPSRANATVLAAPSGFRDRLDSRTAIKQARARGRLTHSETVAIGDTVVLKLTGPGISEAVASERGRTATARFESLLASPNATLSLVETEPGPSLPRQHRYLNETGTTTVVADPANDTYYVAADLTTVPAGYEHDGSFPDPDLREGQRFAPRFLVRSENRINPGDIAEPNQTGHFTVEQPEARLLFRNDTDERYRVGPAPNQTIAGYTNIAPGSAIRVRLSNGTGSQFPVTESVRVSRTEVSEPYDSGYRFRATLNLTGAAPNSSFDVVLRSNGRPISNKYDGYVDPALGLATATPSPTATHTRTATPTTTVQTDQATTTSPGRAAEPTGTTAGDGPGFGASAALAAVVLTLLAAGRDRC